MGEEVVQTVRRVVLANSLKGILGRLIGEAQSAFVPGRSIVDNVLVAYKVNHSLNRQRGVRGEKYADLNLDMSKAYDRVEWNFLEHEMLRMGFDSLYVDFSKIGDSKGETSSSKCVRELQRSLRRTTPSATAATSDSTDDCDVRELLR
ncbi:PREDICTED: uncharacterized protein LOC109180786 [Ipomoea nil]|uniref:uncharacterized protein LOC109180786 n=1 Tax=Ipomoea nil TaxID=35883 RepID=UPI000901DB93|nr:PREDICTED: uncharacterized protein LOC109180786 [Ipomoea nil]